MTHDHDLDELASAYLDGVASPDEVARVDADPALQARVARLAEVRTALHAVPAPPAHQREVALAAARATFDADVTAPSPPSPAARWRWSPRTVRLVGAAAVVLLLAAVVPLLGRLGDDEDSQAARFEETGAAIGGTEDAAERAGDGGEDAGAVSTTADASGGAAGDAGAFRLGHLGDFGSLEDLLAALARSTEQTAPALSEATTDAAPCPTATAGPVATATATVDGQAVIVVVDAPDDEGRRRATVLRESDCRVLERARIP